MNRRDDWNDLVKTCDFEMTACEIRDMLKMWEKEAASSGQEPYYNPEFLAVLYPFLETPSLDTAISLLKVAPATYSMFERCSPGGEFYEMNHFLNRGTELKPDSKQDCGSDPASKQGPVRILVVDDEEGIRTAICSMLTSAGYQCRAVAGGPEALALLDYKLFDALFGDLYAGGLEALVSLDPGEKFDLLLTDMLNLPMDGFTLLQCVKERFPDLPVIVASAGHDNALAEICVRNGAFEYLREPFEREQLLATVGRALRRKEAQTGIEFKREPTYEELETRLHDLEHQAASMHTRLPSSASELKAAFLDSAHSDAPAPPGWWVLPVLGILASLFLLRLSTAFGAICLVLTSSFFGFSLMRAKRNRPRRMPQRP